VRIIVFILVIACFSSFLSRKEKRPFIPPGTAKINDTLFADVHEITLGVWAEYRTSLKRKFGETSNEYLKSAIDTSVWLWGGMNSNEPYMSQHRNLKFYKDYPVVGISYEQATAFCRWRSAWVQRQLEMAHMYPGIKPEYRLPTESEWQMITGNAHDVYDQNNRVVVKKNTPDKKIYLIHYAANSFINDSVKSSVYTVPVGRFKKNRFGCYDLIGNVSEMVKEEGLSKGGSWNQSLEESSPEKKIPYTKPQPWVGFRCVCIVR